MRSTNSLSSWCVFCTCEVLFFRTKPKACYQSQCRLFFICKPWVDLIYYNLISIFRQLILIIAIKKFKTFLKYNFNEAKKHYLFNFDKKIFWLLRLFFTNFSQKLKELASRDKIFDLVNFHFNMHSMPGRVWHPCIKQSQKNNK